MVDDGSHDDVAAVVAEQQNHLPVTLVRHADNRGRAAARNRGASVASGERLVFLDADSYAHPQLLVGHYRFHRSSPHRVLLGARHEDSWDATATASHHTFVEAHKWVQDVRYRWGLDLATFGQHPAPWAFAFTHNMSVPAEQFRACGGFDEQFTRWGYEDVEFGYRLYVGAGRRPGYFEFAPTVVCFHLPHFRRGGSELAEARQMVPHIVRKHQSLEVELLIDRTAGVFYYLPIYLERLRLLHTQNHNSCLAEALDVLSHPQQAGMLCIAMGTRRTVCDEKSLHFINHTPANRGTAPALVGVSLPYAMGRFTEVLNLDLWRILAPRHLSELVAEGLRVANTVHLGFSKSVRGTGLADDPPYIQEMLSYDHFSEVIYDSVSLCIISLQHRSTAAATTH